MESRHVTSTSVVSTSATEAITSFQVPVTVSAAPQSTSPAGELSERGHMRRMIDRVQKSAWKILYLSSQA